MSRIRSLDVLTGLALTVLALLVLAACAAAPAQVPAGHPAAPASRAATSTAQRIPAGATRVTFAVHPDMNVHAKPPKPVTITGQGTVARLAALINGLPPFPPGEYSCPADGGAQLTLTFGTRPAGAALATAVISLEGCEGVYLAIGPRQVALGPIAGGGQTAAHALKIAGLHWNLGTYLFRF